MFSYIAVSLLRLGKGHVLRISVRTLVIRFMSLFLILASPPALASKEASGTLFDHPTNTIHISATYLRRGVRGRAGLTAREKAVFGEDGDGIDEETTDCDVIVSVLF